MALAFARAGADVTVTSRNRADLEAVADEIKEYGQRSLAVSADVSRSADVEDMVGQVLDAFGHIDVLVNNAGINSAFTRALKLSEERWRRTLDVNLTGTFLVSVAVGQHMVKAGSGSVINLISIGARVGLPRLAAYCASKAGIEALTRVLALEWAEHGVRVNAIGPSYVATDMTAGFIDHPYFHSWILEQTPVRRFAEPEDIAGAAIYLASDASLYMTGQTIFVDGGWLAG